MHKKTTISYWLTSEKTANETFTLMTSEIIFTSCALPFDFPMNNQSTSPSVLSPTLVSSLPSLPPLCLIADLWHLQINYCREEMAERMAR